MSETHDEISIDTIQKNLEPVVARQSRRRTCMLRIWRIDAKVCHFPKREVNENRNNIGGTSNEPVIGRVRLPLVGSKNVKEPVSIALGSCFDPQSWTFAIHLLLLSPGLPASTYKPVRSPEKLHLTNHASRFYCESKSSRLWSRQAAVTDNSEVRLTRRSC
ncbi:hypothetical protein EV356DRAFT_77737 [Viridothelium virens]|uniref:Uncharacterized protein n=1 Tax=Viridothelium virens TaxID=1048519 RepID=A0A6A6HE66_VIRVR|nr:hypothetical protein EV356DRAFT_77737 [Viridothelium virens]